LCDLCCCHCCAADIQSCVLTLMYIISCSPFAAGLPGYPRQAGCLGPPGSRHRSQPPHLPCSTACSICSVCCNRPRHPWPGSQRILCRAAAGAPRRPTRHRPQQEGPHWQPWLLPAEQCGDWSSLRYERAEVGAPIQLSLRLCAHVLSSGIGEAESLPLISVWPRGWRQLNTNLPTHCHTCAQSHSSFDFLFLLACAYQPCV
jgi:hypothetical protein